MTEKQKALVLQEIDNMSLHEMRDCIVEAFDVIYYITEREMRVCEGGPEWLEKWDFQEIAEDDEDEIRQKLMDF